jgi:hypothetical protein
MTFHGARWMVAQKDDQYYVLTGRGAGRYVYWKPIELNAFGERWVELYKFPTLPDNAWF